MPESYGEDINTMIKQLDQKVFSRNHIDLSPYKGHDSGVFSPKLLDCFWKVRKEFEELSEASM
ncbi:MAG: hypothetical protein PUD20_06630 [bacterium]|nr:hypothetical protein [bacterium]